MKELDIKEIWQAGDQSKTEYSDEKIQYIIGQSPQNIIESFVKTLKIEKWANLIVLSIAILVLFYFSFWGYALLTLVLDVLFFVYYRQLINQLDKAYVDQKVIEYLNDVYDIICQFIRHFKITLVVVILMSFLVGFFVGTASHGSVSNLIQGLVVTQWIIIISVIGLALAVSFFGFYHMYGKKAKKIQQMIIALNEEEIG